MARTGHPLTAKERLALKDLAGFPQVLDRADTPLRESIGSFFGSERADPPMPAVETGDLALLRGLLLESSMLIMVSASQLHHEVRIAQLMVLPLEMPGLERRISVTALCGAQLSPRARALLKESSAPPGLVLKVQ